MALDAQQDDPLVGHFGGDSGPASSPLATTKEPDDPLIGHFGTGSEGGVTPYTPAPDWHASDLPKGLSVGLHGGVGAPLAEVTGQTEEAAAERKAAEEARQGMTPGAEQTWPVWGAEQVAPTAALLGPGAALGVAGAPAAAVLGTGALIGGAIQGGSAISGNKEVIEQTDDSTLQANNPTYAEDRKSGMTEQEAKAKLGQSMALNVGLPSAALGMVMGGAGGIELGGLLKMGVGDAEQAALTGSGLTRRVTGPVPSAIVGAGRGAAEMGIPGAAQEAVSKHAEAQEGAGQEATGEELLNAGVGQGLFGALVGGAGGLIHGRPAPPNRTQTGGQATIVRETPAQKASASKRTDGSTRPVDMTQQPGVSDSTTGPYSYDPSAPGTKEAGSSGAPVVQSTAPPSAPPKVDPAQEVALKGEPVTQGVTKPPEPSVEQPPVVQPTTPPPRIDTAGQGEGDTTSPLPPPQPPPEPQPLPRAAPPVEDAGAIVPESAETWPLSTPRCSIPATPGRRWCTTKGRNPLNLMIKRGLVKSNYPMVV